MTWSLRQLLHLLVALIPNLPKTYYVQSLRGGLGGSKNLTPNQNQQSGGSWPTQKHSVAAQILSTSSFPLSDASMSHSSTDLTVAIHTGFYEHFHFLFSIHTSQSLRTHRSLGTSASGSSIVAAGCPSSLGACQTICEFHLWWYHFFPIYMIQIFCKIQ